MSLERLSESVVQGVSGLIRGIRTMDDRNVIEDSSIAREREDEMSNQSVHSNVHSNDSQGHINESVSTVPMQSSSASTGPMRSSVQNEIDILKAESLRLQLWNLRKQSFFPNFDGAPASLIQFLENARTHAERLFPQMNLLSIVRHGRLYDITKQYTYITREDLCDVISRRNGPSTEDECFYEAVQASCSTKFLSKLGATIHLANVNDKRSGITLLHIIANHCNLHRKSGRVLQEEYDKLSLSKVNYDVVKYTEQLLFLYNELKAVDWDCEANGHHAEVCFRELMSSKSTPFVTAMSIKHNDFSLLSSQDKRDFNLQELTSYAQERYRALLNNNSMEPSTKRDDELLSALLGKKVKDLSSKSLTSYLANLKRDNNKAKSKFVPAGFDTDKFHRWAYPKGDEATSRKLSDGTEIKFCKLHKWNKSHGTEDCRARKKGKEGKNSKTAATAITTNTDNAASDTISAVQLIRALTES